MAKIYAVGVGPGDPELLTRKAERILRQTPVICAPTANPADSSYALSIVEQFLDRSRQEIIGDPFLYSTFLYIYRIFRKKYPDLAIEVVPGISSINAAAVAAGVPLGMGAERIAVLPAAFADARLKQTLLEFDTVVLMKVSRVFDSIFALLRELGLERNGVFISRVGTPEERVEFDLESLTGRKLDYLSLLIVKK